MGGKWHDKYPSFQEETKSVSMVSAFKQVILGGGSWKKSLHLVSTFYSHKYCVLNKEMEIYLKIDTNAPELRHIIQQNVIHKIEIHCIL